MLNVSIYLLFGILIITAVLMVLIVLMQRPKNEGLGASFGGGMTQDLFGAQTTNVLQKFTVYLGAIFFGSCLLLTILYSKSSTQQSAIQKQLAATATAKKLLPVSSPTPQAAIVATPTASPTPAAPTPSATPTFEATPTPLAASAPEAANPVPTVEPAASPTPAAAPTTTP